MTLMTKYSIFNILLFVHKKQMIQFLRNYSQEIPIPLRSQKKKSQRRDTIQAFVDSRSVRAIGGRGGDGCISFMRLWSNPDAGPDGGDGGNGGHVLLHATNDVNDLHHIDTVLQAAAGEKGYNKDCNGKNAPHTVVKVPVGTLVKSHRGTFVADLSQDGAIFIAARGGAGGKGNHFFASDVNQAPEVAEYGAQGEETEYFLELSSMAHVGLVGFPNAGKSTLLQAITRARPKVAPYPFTTLQPHLGIVAYDDHEQVAVADLPGLIPGSHRNRGLGISFLKHTERCSVLLFLLDASDNEPWEHLAALRHEIQQFNPEMNKRPSLIVINKIDLPAAQANLPQLKKHISEPIITISAKHGTNLTELLTTIRKLHDEFTKRNIYIHDE